MLLRLFAVLVSLLGLGLLWIGVWIAWVKAGLVYQPPGTMNLLSSAGLVLALATAALVSGVQLLRRRRWSLVVIASLAGLLLALDVRLVLDRWAHHGADLRDFGGDLIPLLLLLASVGFYFRWPYAPRS